MISLKYTSASRKRVTHTEQMKLRDKQKKFSTRPLRSNRAEFLKTLQKYTSASRNGAAELRDKGSIVSTSIFCAPKFPQVQLSSEQVVINLP